MVRNAQFSTQCKCDRPRSCVAYCCWEQGDAFKQVADTRAVIFCVEGEKRLCSKVISALTARDPMTVNNYENLRYAQLSYINCLR